MKADAEQRREDHSLEEQARELARHHRASRAAGRTPTPLERLGTLEGALRDAYARFVAMSEEEGHVPGVGEWLLDNFYLVQQAVRQIEKNMPPGYYRRLPKLEKGRMDGYPRVYVVARDMVRALGGSVEANGVRRYTHAYQEVQPLTMGEIWALPTMLRLCALEILTWHVVQATDGDEDAFDGDLPGPPEVGEQADEMVVAGAINSLRAIETEDWDAFFEAVSLVEETLGLDPANVYGAMDFDSRDQYRAVVEELARAVDESEEHVAQEAVRLARRQGRANADESYSNGAFWHRRAHVGYYLIGEGRSELEDVVGFRPTVAERTQRWVFDHSALVYLVSIGLLSALALAGALLYAHAAGAGVLGMMVVSVLALIPASVVGVNVVNVVITQTVAPRVLPKLDLSDGMPPEFRTMVVVPSLLTSNEDVDFLLRQLELHYLGNTDPEFGFALLTDFADAPEKHMPEDEDLLERAKDGIRRLNVRYGQGDLEEGASHGDGAGPFYLFHRERLWNPSEVCWMGWERKRGKLVEFNRLLRGEDETSYVVVVGDRGFLAGVEYVITLDADTVFPLESGHRLVGALAHPLNGAAFDNNRGDEEGHVSASDASVVAGYTVLQPRTEVKPTAATQTTFSRIFAGDMGLDLYTRAVSDIYQDFFGEGIYVGKGIYDVDAFERSLRGCVPKNALLSHDLFEGIHGRAGLVTDVVVYEDYPASYLSYAHRQHRWVRGDWQLLPWLFSTVPHAGEGRIANRLSALDRWKILDNLRRSLRVPALFLLLVVGWLALPGSAWVWTVGALVTAGMPLITGAVTQMARRVQGGARGGGAPRLRSELERWLLSLAFLPYKTILMLDAVGTTLVRLTISRKRLLQWTTAAHTARLLGRESKIGLLWRQMRGGPVLALITGALLAVLRPMTLPLAAPLLLGWLLSPQIAAWISRSVEEEQEQLTSQARGRLRCLARRTWLYFERFVGPDDHWLPPDHFQEEPRGVVARRTSPTNIGLMLVSTLAAYDMGYIGLTELALRTGYAFDSMDELERYQGHLLNWYDTRDLSTLKPRYVSTVDSGNLVACLMALRQGLQELPHEPVLRWRSWRGLCDTVEVFVEVVGEIADRDEVIEEVRAVRAFGEELCDKMWTAREEPERWIPLLGEVEDGVRGEFTRRLEALLDVGSGVLAAGSLRDLRLWSERIHIHLRDLRGEVDQKLPWIGTLDEQPALLAGDGTVDVPERMVREVSSHEAWQGLKESLLTIPALDEMADVVGKARAQLDDLTAFVEEEIGAVRETTSPEAVEQLEEVRAFCGTLQDALEAGRAAAKGLERDLKDLIERAERYVEETNFGFLYDRQRDVFHLGYRVDAEELDSGHYDLLASEARIASIVAISKGDVPKRHWLHLSRPLSGELGGEKSLRGLLSWGGSMFEYLMPDLLMRNYGETLLHQASLAAVRHQIAYGREKGVPWGISESGYYRLDAQMNYQYRAFGVPGLGRKRGLGEDLVVAPYASLLAVGIVPDDVLENLDALIEEGMLGHYGLYEAVDYTESRVPMGQRRAIVRSYMVHHQGMIMAALAKVVDGQGIVRRFHADPRIESVEFLLQEQVPREVPVEEQPEESVAVERPEEERVTLEPWSVSTVGSLPQVHLLSNGRYGVLISEAGAGYSAYNPSLAGEGEATALSRWRADATLDCWGTWIYVRDEDNGVLLSASEQPTGARADEEQVDFYPHQAVFHRRHGDLSLHTEITVAPQDDVEIRRLTLTNHSDESRRLRVTSYGEIVLASQDQDRSHPAFNSLFIESEYIEEVNGLLFTRRPRLADEELPFVVHLLVTPGDVEESRLHESDRCRFIGRGGTVAAPASLGGPDGAAVTTGDGKGEWLSGTTGATLDPIMALGQEIEMAPHTTVELAYLTLAAKSRGDALEMARLYRAWRRIDRAFGEAHAQSEAELRNRGLEVSDLQVMQKILAALLYPHESLRAAAETLAANERGQSTLWGLGISGDYPILLVRIADEERVGLVRELLKAHAYWRERQLKIDLVILNEKDVGYAQELSERLNQVIKQMDSDAWLNRRGGVFVVRADQMEEKTRVLLETAARAVLDADKGSLSEQVEKTVKRPSRLPALKPSSTEPERETTAPVTRPQGLRFDNGFGGFSEDGREYVTYLKSGTAAKGTNGWTPAPWINVIANGAFGFLVSETGLGCSWAANSGENRLTPWRNDPVSDTPAEAVYLRDEETGAIWSPTPLPAGEDAPYLTRHGAGYSIFRHNSHGLRQRLRVFAAQDAPVKVVQVRLENTWERPRRLTVTYFAEWVLGVNRDQAQQYVVSEYDSETTALLVRNTYSPEFSERVGFAVASEGPHGLTADRTEFLGRKGAMSDPAALHRVGLSGRVEPGLDPCAAVQVHVDLAPGEGKEFHFLLGQGEDRDGALALVRAYRDPEKVAAEWEQATAFWDERLGVVTVDTPDEAMDLLLNRWLLYQALSCRIWGRTALYQSSGAYGFRDQLQDVMSLLHAAPEIAREHLLRAARHQFEEGDVLHWWNPPSGHGIRSRVTDDLLWLPYATAEYVEATGDEGILEEEEPFRKAEPLEDDEDERYGLFELTEEKATLYEHCVRALNKGSTAGRHGLPLIGTGDWNDGMNRVGSRGEGESIWLGWFLYAGLTRFARLCSLVGDEEQADVFRERASDLQEALEASAWDGEWYIRATYDDGTPVGSKESEECKIASNAQSWAVLSGAGSEERVEQAMASVADWLVREYDQGTGLVLVFTPPFDDTARDPGYIKGYPPGIRENGGQYTHAALWTVWAYTQLGQGDLAGDLFRLMNPVYHSDTRAKAERYRVEPYVIAADVYSAEGHLGRGGWTWYTGSSGWMYRLGIEAILGLRRVGDALHIEPCIPHDWSSYRMTYQYGETVYAIEVDNPDGVNRGVAIVHVDGEEVPGNEIALRDDGERHEVRVRMG